MNLISERQYHILKRLANDAELCGLPLAVVIKACEEHGWNYQPARAALLITADLLASLED